MWAIPPSHGIPGSFWDRTVVFLENQNCKKPKFLPILYAVIACSFDGNLCRPGPSCLMLAGRNEKDQLRGGGKGGPGLDGWLPPPQAGPPSSFSAAPRPPCGRNRPGRCPAPAPTRPSPPREGPKDRLPPSRVPNPSGRPPRILRKTRPPPPAHRGPKPRSAMEPTIAFRSFPLSLATLPQPLLCTLPVLPPPTRPIRPFAHLHPHIPTFLPPLAHPHLPNNRRAGRRGRLNTGCQSDQPNILTFWVVYLTPPITRVVKQYGMVQPENLKPNSLSHLLSQPNCFPCVVCNFWWFLIIRCLRVGYKP